MQLYPGVDTVTVLDAITPKTGYGVWPGPQEAQGGDLRSAANLMTMGETLTDRTNFVGWRTVNWIDGGTQECFAAAFIHGNGGFSALGFTGTMQVAFGSGITVVDSGTWTHAGVHTFTAGGLIFNTATGLTVNAGATLIVSSVLFALTMAQPAATADPGANNLLFSTNTSKAWGVFTTDGAGGVVISDGYNILNVNISTAGARSHIVVAFARSMASANFAAVCTINTALTVAEAFVFTGAKSVSSFSIYANSGGGGNVDFAAGVFSVSVVVMARQ